MSGSPVVLLTGSCARELSALVWKPEGLEVEGRQGLTGPASGSLPPPEGSHLQDTWPQSQQGEDRCREPKGPLSLSPAVPLMQGCSPPLSGTSCLVEGNKNGGELQPAPLPFTGGS